MGHLADNWGEPTPNMQCPAVVLNPKADPLDVLGWLWGEVEALLVTTRALSESQAPLDGADLAAIFLHRLEPIESVVESLVRWRLAKRRVAGGGAL